jgi:hypothetical protein
VGNCTFNASNSSSSISCLPNFFSPVIVKLHHDYLLSPKHTTKDTDALTPELKKNLDPVLAGVHLIVIGYGGFIIPPSG